MLLIPNATNDRTKSRSFLPAHPGNQQSCLQETSVRRMLYETRARIYNKRMLIAQDCIKFRGRRARAYLHDRDFLSQLCWFPGCADKNNLGFVQPLVAFGIRNISYRGFSRHCAHSIAQVVTTMAAMLDIFLCSITRKKNIQHGGCRDDSWWWRHVKTLYRV